MTAHVPSLTLATLTDAALRSRSTDTTVTLAIDATRQVVTILPTGRITVRSETDA